MTPKIIAAIFVNDENQILLLKRTKERRSYPNRWGVLSGTIEEGETPKECLGREIKEEIGISKYKIITEGNPYIDTQKEGKWKVYPYLCKIIDGDIILDKKENDVHKWISVCDLGKYNTVPGIKTDLTQLGIQ